MATVGKRGWLLEDLEVGFGCPCPWQAASMPNGYY